MREGDKINKSIMKKVREQLGLNQEEFAKALGVRRATVSDWETGKVFPKWIEQAKALDTLLSEVDLRIKDISDEK